MGEAQKGGMVDGVYKTIDFEIEGEVETPAIEVV